MGFFSKKKSKQAVKEVNQPKKGKRSIPNTLVIDLVEGFDVEYVKKPKGMQWSYGKQQVYLMLRHNGTMKPIELPKKIGVFPEKLYRALFWERETDILFTLRNTLLEKLNTLLTVGLIGILLFFIYLIFSSL